MEYSQMYRSAIDCSKTVDFELLWPLVYAASVCSLYTAHPAYRSQSTVFPNSPSCGVFASLNGSEMYLYLHVKIHIQARVTKTSPSLQIPVRTA